MNRCGFTLVEILIVVIILAILAVMVIPQFSAAADDARRTRLVSDLQTVRYQIELYKAEHRGALPTALGGGAACQLCNRTNADGEVGQTAAHCYGPYLQDWPTNEFSDLNTVQMEAGEAGLGDGTHGWHLNTTTGKFSADDAAHSHL